MTSYLRGGPKLDSLCCDAPSRDGLDANDPLSTEKVSSSKPRGRTAPERLSPSGTGPQGWSIYGAQRAQPVATGGKWDDPENRSNKPIRNRWQMVRNAMKKGLPGDRLRFVTGSYRRGGPLQCCTPDWI